MADQNLKRLRRATIVFWVLFAYIIAALIWWFISLEQQSKDMYELRKHDILKDFSGQQQQKQLSVLENWRRRNSTKYIGEGVIFLLLIIFGAAFIYRSVKRQFKLQQQQQNFLMAITHELKTPIAVSRLNLETMQRYQLDEQKQKKLLQTSLNETLRLDTLINNILVASQLDGHAYKISKEELDFSSLVTDVCQQFRSRYPERKLATAIEDDIDINGDPLLLKLLLSNLLENAEKYAPKGTPIACSLQKTTRNVCLTVQDEGPGIANDEKKKVFQKFYRVGSEHTRKTQGTGLGLFLCRRIAAEHNAEICVKDNQPAGSNFIVQFHL